MTTYRPEPKNYPDARLDLIYFDAGGGHRASATALISAARQQHRSWNINLINLRDLLEPADVIRRLTGVRVENFYNSQLKYGLTIGTGPLLRITQMLIRQFEPNMIGLLARHWQTTQPDLVVSVVPNFNHAIFEGLRQADAAQSRPETPMVTILTDFADCPPHFWIERQSQYLVCGTETAASQAIAMRHDPARVFRTSGMIVRPEFYQPMELKQREAERARLGLDPELPTGIVMFGSYGSSQMESIARRIETAQLKTQLIFICGHNDKLRETHRKHEAALSVSLRRFHPGDSVLHAPRRFFHWQAGSGEHYRSARYAPSRNRGTQRMDDGARALQYGLDRAASAWSSAAVVPSDRRAVSTMLDREQFLRLRANVNAIDNRAVFEIPEILEDIIARHRAANSTFALSSIVSAIRWEIHYGI